MMIEYETLLVTLASWSVDSRLPRLRRGADAGARLRQSGRGGKRVAGAPAPLNSTQPASDVTPLVSRRLMAATGSTADKRGELAHGRGGPAPDPSPPWDQAGTTGPNTLLRGRLVSATRA